MEHPISLEVATPCSRCPVPGGCGCTGARSGLTDLQTSRRPGLVQVPLIRSAGNERWNRDAHAIPNVRAGSITPRLPRTARTPLSPLSLLPLSPGAPACRVRANPASRDASPRWSGRCSNARTGHVWMDSSRQWQPVPATRLASRRPPGDLKKSRRNPGPMSLASFGHLCTMFGPTEHTVEDLEGKSRSEQLRTLVVPRCKPMPTANLGESPHSPRLIVCSSKEIASL